MLLGKMESIQWAVFHIDLCRQQQQQQQLGLLLKKYGSLNIFRIFFHYFYFLGVIIPCKYHFIYFQRMQPPKINIIRFLMPIMFLIDATQGP